METLDKFSKPFQKQVLNQYRGLVRSCRNVFDRSSMSLIRGSFEFLVANTEEKLTIHGKHPIIYFTSLARMMVKELDLDALSISAAMVIHCVEKNSISPDRIRTEVNERTASLVEELLKIGTLDTTTKQGQAENMRNLILTLATDFRVILVKVAERLHLIRQMERLGEQEQITLACEVKFIYSPLAHRLGLYNVMSEMEDISMSVLEKEAFQTITEKLRASTQRRNKFIREFIQPIKEDLSKEKFHVLACKYGRRSCAGQDTMNFPVVRCPVD